MEVLGAAASHRIAYVAEDGLHPSQYAYGLARGTDMQMTALTDFIGRHLTAGRFGYLASLDVAGAFDAAPHGGPAGTLWRVGLAGHSVRFLTAWLRGRRFRTRRVVPTVRFVSMPRKIPWGLPQGGIISPLLRLLRFYRLLECWDTSTPGPKSRVAGGEVGGCGEDSRCLAFADDVTFDYADAGARPSVVEASKGDERASKKPSECQQA